jgi:hypothetical protein
VVEEERLFDGAHVDLRVLVEVVVERGRPRLLRAYYEEVGHRHLTTSPASPRKNALSKISILSKEYRRASMPPLLGSVNNLAVFPPTRIARFAEIGVYRVRYRLVQSGLLVIGTYIHHRYVRVGSSEVSTGATGPTEIFQGTVRS